MKSALVTWAFAIMCQAQSLTYSLLPSNSPEPSARFDGTITYDTGARQVFLFGGQDASPRNDLWAYSTTEKRWAAIPVSGPIPPARFGHTLVFDSVRRQLILFGGQAGSFFSDVWAFDIASASWLKLSDDGSGPSRRYGHSAIYDTARDRMVISHGFTNAGRYDDTWTFDLSTKSWHDISPAGTRPLRRCLHHAAYDAERGQMYLYGGCSSGFGPCPQGDLWSFDLSLNRWMERTPKASPPAREHYGMAFDAVRSKLVVFGGDGSGLLDDTWEYDPQSGGWQQATLSGASPSPRQRLETVYAPDSGAFFFFGGATQSGLTNELWTLRPQTVGGPSVFQSGGVLNAFSGEGPTVAPGEVVSIFGTGLGPANGVDAEFDSATGHLPTSISGVSVKWSGVASPIFYAQLNQLNVQVPYEVAGLSQANMVVVINGQSGDPINVAVQPTRPGLVQRVWNQDGTVNSPANSAVPGTVVVLYATGQGETNPPSRTGARASGSYPEPVASTALFIGGLAAEILFRGQAPGMVGVMQINARVPEGVAGGAAVPAVLRVGESEAKANIAISAK